MIYKEFIDEIKEAMLSEFGHGYDIKIEYSKKMNNKTYTGLMINRTDLCFAPVIYLDYYFEEYVHGASIQEIKSEIVDKYHEFEIEDTIDVSYLLSFEKIKEHIYCKIINYYDNHELLQSVPYQKFLDLAVVCYYEMPDHSKISGTITIQNKMLKYWGISMEELFRIARENSRMDHPFKFIKMEDLLLSLMGEWPFVSDEESNMYVLTNSTHLYGAVSMQYLDVLSHISDQLNSSYYILPSSIHECILIPDRGEINEMDLVDLVKDINAEYVPEDEKLSDSVYYYKRETCGIGMINIEK